MFQVQFWKGVFVKGKVRGGAGFMMRPLSARFLLSALSQVS